MKLRTARYGFAYRGLVLALIVGAGFFALGAAQRSSGKEVPAFTLKGVFISEEAPQASSEKVARIGIRHFVNGRWKIVPFHHSFLSGDMFRFEVSANHDGWLYIWTKGSDAQPKLLWPRRSSGDTIGYLDDHAVKARQVHLAPGHPKVFIFNDDVGAETFYVAISPSGIAPRLTSQTRRARTKSSPAVDEAGNEIVQFGVKGLGRDANNVGRKYVPSQETGDPFVYFSADADGKTGLTMIEFQLQHE